MPVRGKCLARQPNGTDCYVELSRACESGWCNPTTHRCDDHGDFSCDVDDDCPRSPHDARCAERACTAGMCGERYTPPTTPIEQSPGNCNDESCDGAGNVVRTPNDLDNVYSTFCGPYHCDQGMVVDDPHPPAGTSCGSGAEVCDGNACVVPTLRIYYSPTTNAPGEVRVLAGGVEVARCTAACTVPIVPGAQYVVESSSPWPMTLEDCPTTGPGPSCTFTAGYLDIVRFSFHKPPQLYIPWTFEGQAGEVMRAASGEGNDTLVGSDRRLIRLDSNGAVLWTRPLPVSSIARGFIGFQDITYVLSNDQLIQIDSAGMIRWQRQVDACPRPDEFPSCLAVDPINGDVVFGGSRAMRFTPNGTLVWATAVNPLWVHNTIAVDQSGVTHLLRSDTGSNGIVASRLAPDGTPLPTLLDIDGVSLTTPDVRFGTQANQVVVGYHIGPDVTLRHYREDGLLLGAALYPVGTGPFGLYTNGSWHAVAQLDPVLGGAYVSKGNLTLPGITPHGVEQWSNFIVVGTYQHFDQQVGWVQPLWF